MFGIPTLVRILKYLRDEATPHTYEDIISETLASQGNAEKALAKLVESGVVQAEGGLYRYIPTSKAEEFCQKLFALYEQVLQRPRLELLLRGILSQSAPRYFFRKATLMEMLEREGFSSQEVAQKIEEEIEMGYISQLKLVFVTKFPFSPPVYVPLGYISHFGPVPSREYEALREYSQIRGLNFLEEEYLQADYPLELAELGQEYLENEAGEILERLREEAFRQWYGLRR
ncbi:MAG: hypothetical protein DRI26_02375 [Chloroflexi bacterium]|nr:MAG: hypothetical protein DRI26_02375 [Chloroflexota bacterium]